MYRDSDWEEYVPSLGENDVGRARSSFAPFLGRRQNRIQSRERKSDRIFDGFEIASWRIDGEYAQADFHNNWNVVSSLI